MIASKKECRGEKPRRQAILDSSAYERLSGLADVFGAAWRSKTATVVCGGLLFRLKQVSVSLFILRSQTITQQAFHSILRIPHAHPRLDI
jgi:hypothetical protein